MLEAEKRNNCFLMEAEESEVSVRRQREKVSPDPVSGTTLSRQFSEACESVAESSVKSVSRIT